MNYAQLGTPRAHARAHARVRHFRFTQLQAWHVPAIVSLLPLVMHIALGIFLAGLIIHIRAMSTRISLVVGGIVLCAFVSYVGTNLLPIRDPTCPYKTPLSNQIVETFFAGQARVDFTFLPLPRSGQGPCIGLLQLDHK